jgi:hypothetical protein
MVDPWGLPAVGLMAPPIRVKYRVKERETKERETWENLSLSLSHQEKKKQLYEFLRWGISPTEKFLIVVDVFCLGGTLASRGLEEPAHASRGHEN